MKINYNTINNPTFCSGNSMLTDIMLEKIVDSGLSGKKIANKFNVSSNGIISRSKKKYLAPTNKQSDSIDYSVYDFYYLRTLIDEGNSITQLARYYKQTVSHIRRVLKHYKLKTQEAVLAQSIKKEDLLRYISEGKSPKQISEIFFLDDPTTLTHVSKKSGLNGLILSLEKSLSAEKIADLIFKGMKSEEIAERYKVSPTTILNIIKSSGFQEVYQSLYQPHDIPRDEIINLIKSGYSVFQIAEMYHSSLNQIVRYMVKNNILKSDISLRELIKSVRHAESNEDLVLNYDVFENSVQKLLADNYLKTKTQQVRNIVLKNEIVEDIPDSTNYAELARKLWISPAKSKRIVVNCCLKSDNRALTLPAVEQILNVMMLDPKISKDELARRLNVDISNLDKVMIVNNIKIYTPHNVKDFSSLDFIRWVASLINQGDTPVQLGALMGLSSHRARRIVEELSNRFNGSELIEFPKIPIDKSSPKREDIMREIINLSRVCLFPKGYQYDDRQINLAKNYIIEKICCRYNISDVTFEYLLKRHELEDIFDSYVQKIVGGC